MARISTSCVTKTSVSLTVRGCARRRGRITVSTHTRGCVCGCAAARASTRAASTASVTKALRASAARARSAAWRPGAGRDDREGALRPPRGWATAGTRAAQRLRLRRRRTTTGMRAVWCGAWRALARRTSRARRCGLRRWTQTVGWTEATRWSCCGAGCSSCCLRDNADATCVYIFNSVEETPRRPLACLCCRQLRRRFRIRRSWLRGAPLLPLLSPLRLRLRSRSAPRRLRAVNTRALLNRRRSRALRSSHPRCRRRRL